MLQAVEEEVKEEEEAAAEEAEPAEVKGEGKHQILPNTV